MSKMKDFFATLKNETLEDLEDIEEKAPKKVKRPASKKKSSEKQEPAKKESTREPRSSTEALLNAFEYAASQDVSADLTAALKGKEISNDLRKLLQVLVDNDNFRKLLLSQAEVKKPEPKPDEYDLDPVYTDKDGKIVYTTTIFNAYSILVVSSPVMEEEGATSSIPVLYPI